MWDEAGAGRGLARRQAMTTDNIEFNKILQVIRKRRYIVFFTVPSIESLDKASIDYFGGKITPMRIHKEKKLCYVKFQEKQTTGFNFVIWPYIRYSGHRITSIPIPKIKESFARKYEKGKDEFLAEIIKGKKKRGRPKNHIPDIIGFSESLKNRRNEFKGVRGGYNIGAIQAEYLQQTGKQLGRSYAAQIISLLKKNDN